MSASPIADYHAFPDAQGHFGRYGGSFVAETLVGPLQELAQAYDQARQDPAFQLAYDRDLAHYVGRPSPIYHAQRLSDHVGGAQILLKREDLNHTGAHKINNTIGQALLAARMGKKRIIAETGAGQHGVASATVAARLGLECVVYMGATDIERQKINVYRMKLLGATVVPVTSGSATLKDALNEAMRDWVTNVHDTFYIIGTVAGPDPYPRMVRDFNAIVGREARAQMLTDYGRLPDAITACVGGGSNAIGLFHAFLNDRDVRIVGAEALVRWNHPELGAQSPAEFIKVLEDSGLILEVGTWILDEACEAFKQLIALKLVDPLNFSLCVNISPRQFRQNDFVERIEHSMSSHGLPYSLLKLEITEGIVIQNLEDTISKMRRLKKLGVSFAMDDFGTGYSSLTYLQRLPVDTLKIDQSFIRDATTDPNDAEIIRAIVAMARSLELEVIAEGVETPEQLAFLQGLGCHLYQGYLHSRPVALEALKKMLE